MNTKKYISKFKLILIVFSIGLVFNSCETTELNLLDDPNALNPNDATADGLFNDAQLEMNRFFNGTANTTGLTDIGQPLTRLTQFTGGDYFTGFGTGTMFSPYRRAYSVVVRDIRGMNVLAEQEGLIYHIALGKIIESYTMMSIVDFLGDVPYSEAFQSSGNFNPSVDSGASIYDALEILLDEAIVTLDAFDAANDSALVPANDLYYAGDMAKWSKFANTLKFKMYLQRRLLDDGTYATKINSILAKGVISDPSEDFQFQYTTTNENPDSRHPLFTNNYDSGVSGYQSNWLMNEMVNGKTVLDPRTRYYFFRQTTVPGDESQMPCGSQTAPSHYGSEDAFCYIDGGWLGRDHGNGQGIPPDDAIRTVTGLYPAGGLFDGSLSANQFIGGSDGRDLGAKGAGISPIMLSSFVKFMQVESALELGTLGDPRVMLEEAVRSSITKVTTLNNESLTVADAPFEPSTPEIDAYVNDVLSNYDNATDKMQVVMKEYLIALFGNGVEAYNSYRRTGFPNDLQPMLTSAPGVFIRSLFYPSNMVDNNSSINQKQDQTTSVFWDTNPNGFVD